MKVAVVTDSACGMSHLNIKMEGLYMIPLQITDGVDNYLEGVNITNDQCYQMMFMGKHMKSSQPSYGQIEELFVSLKKEYIILLFLDLLGWLKLQAMVNRFLNMNLEIKVLLLILI